jgi:hypothetical protein
MMRSTALLLILLAGCASSQNDPNAPDVTVHLAQLETAPNAFTFGGAVNVPFAVTITNTTKDPVTFTRLQIQTIGSGAYTIRPTSTQMNVQLNPGESKTMAISLWGSARGGNLASGEPVTIRGTAYLSGPQGAFLRLFTEYITEQ